MKCLVALLFSVYSAAFAASPTVTLAFTFEKEYSHAVLSALQSELDTLLQPSGASLEWQSVGAIQGHGVPNRLVVITFRGSCQPYMTPPWIRPLGSLGDSAVVDGVVLPFARIDCDLVRSLLGHSLSQANGRASVVFGRALGRVVAHELYHILAGTSLHGSTGIAKSRFGIQDLLSESIALDSASAGRIGSRASQP